MQLESSLLREQTAGRVGGAIKREEGGGRRGIQRISFLNPVVAPRGSKCNSTHPQFLTPYPHVSLLDYVVEVRSHGDRKPSASRLGLLFVLITEMIIRLVINLIAEERGN